jgi:hypothetical protein
LRFIDDDTEGPSRSAPPSLRPLDAAPLNVDDGEHPFGSLDGTGDDSHATSRRRNGS